MNNDKEDILQELLYGNFSKAIMMSRRWVEDSPEDLDAWLMLAECAYFQADSDAVLQALIRAKQIDGDHPMFYRMLTLGAIQAKAFTAAHGAVYSARLAGLPAAIRADLDAQLLQKALISEHGDYPEPENPDPRWRSLLLPMWQVRHDPVDLCWSEYQGYIWVYPQFAVEPAIAFSNGAGAEVWDRFPAAKEKAQLFFEPDMLKTRDPSPAMLPAFQVIYLPAALHLAGNFPEMVEQDVARISTPNGWMLHIVRFNMHYCIIEKPALAEGLQRLLKTAFEGRIHLTGPDHRLEAALPWLTSNFPFSKMEDYLK